MLKWGIVKEAVRNALTIECWLDVLKKRDKEEEKRFSELLDIAEDAINRALPAEGRLDVLEKQLAASEPILEHGVTERQTLHRD